MKGLIGFPTILGKGSAPNCATEKAWEDGDRRLHTEGWSQSILAWEWSVPPTAGYVNEGACNTRNGDEVYPRGRSVAKVEVPRWHSAGIAF